jgi:GNAT superfamily N-acetyltransferase
LNSLEIKEFKKSDLSRLTCLIHETILQCYPSCYPPEVVEFFIDYHRESEILRKAEEGTVLLAFLQEKLVGCGYLLNDEVGGIYIHPDYQKQGFGKELLNQLLAKAKELALKNVWLDSTPIAKKMYLDAGFVIQEEKVMYVENNAPLEYSYMTKKLIR